MQLTYLVDYQRIKHMEFLAYSIVWCLAVFGATNILTVGAIFAPLRNFLQFKRKTQTLRKWKLPGKLFNCPMCIGFWIGVLFGIMIWSPSYNLMFKSELCNQYWRMLFDGCLGSISSWLLYLHIADKQFRK